MTRHALRGWVVAGLLLVVVLVGFVVALAGAQRQSRDDIRARFDQRADLSAALTASVFGSSYETSQQEFAKRFGAARVSGSALSAWARRNHTLSVVVLNARGGLVAASQRTPRWVLADLLERPAYVRQVLAGGHYGLSSVLRGEGGSGPVVQFAQPFRTSHGLRVLVSGFRPQLLYSFFSGYLSKVPNRGGHSYVLDANGIVVGAPNRRVTPGAYVSEPGLLAALARSSSGTFGERYFTSSPVRGSGWRVVLTSPKSVLFASISGTRMWLPWIIVAAFVLAGILALLALLRSMRNAAGLRRSEQRYALVVSGSNDGIWDLDMRSQELYVSPRWKEMLGLPAGERASSDAWHDRVHPDDVARLDTQVAAVLRGELPALDLEYRMRHEDGTYRWVLVRGAVERDAGGQPTRLAGSMSDITARKLAEDKLREDALHDSLTGLANRALFLDRLAVALDKAHRDPDRRCAVLFLDLDRFKLINDSFSHAVGDELLVELGHRLSVVLRPGDTVARGAPDDTVARLGGDEFTILLDDVRSPDAPMQVAERILHSLERPFMVRGREISVSASIGIAFSDPGATAAEMMRNADLAMYEAKRQGIAAAALYSTDMHERVTERLDLEIALRSAIEQGTMRVFFQPIVHLESGRLAGFEALSRWPAGLPPVTPDEFVPVAEETGLIGRLGRHVLGTACAQLQAWRDAGVVADGVTVSVNIAACQLCDPGRLIADVNAALEESGLPPELLRLEITESTMVREPERLQATLTYLREIGVRAHIDDFGTGYSSLQFLQHFPGDTLKVDRSFVSSMLEDEGHHEIVRAIVKLAHDLGLKTIAEGIDDAGQLEHLHGLGCEHGQGFLFSPPVDAATAATLARDWDEAAILAAFPALAGEQEPA